MAWASAPRQVALVMPRVGERPRRLSAGHARRVSVGRARPHRSGRPRQRVVRARSRPRGAPLRARHPRHRRQRQRHDRAGHQHVPDRRRERRALGGDRPGAGARRPRRCDRRRRARADRPHLRHPHPQGPLAGDAGAEGAHRRDRARPAAALPGMAGRHLRRRRDAARRRTDRARASGHAPRA